ncbi:diaminopimelate epimerase [Brevibacillus composti]|uniref:Diaminopimelate epimerase n=1 Tax=Brevibacillus composti TaxID=2796470 RepID=A0A7T5JP20_9BACL|nr:diaminopimelate epimerase [Brevibacillus composti]QQE74789.1 diaminopimelate epimerase [Brevibacillus composti]QUO41874.1 diaminopimelate epimerase [Brevibacillus composti]
MTRKRIPFAKMNGCGNDFIVVDNRDHLMDGFDLSAFVKNVCARGTSVGADGFMMLEPSEIADFTMRYFNADGSEGEMCGNGARCLSRFAHLVGAAGETMSFETLAGIYHAEILSGSQTVRVKFPDVSLSELQFHQPYAADGPAAQYHYGFVGVPHTVWFVDRVAQLADEQLIRWGKQIRYDKSLFPQGTNVNFVEVLDPHTLQIRTYERGVEAETYACGSGSTAAAIIAGILGIVEASAPVTLLTRRGTLRISYQIAADAARDVYLEGDAKLVARGELLPDAWLPDHNPPAP